jgi:glycosyltransferase involved in cell wall biosynthesis
MILLVNQHTVPVFTDVANAFAAAGEKTTLFVGHVEPGRAPLHPSIRRVNSIAYSRKSAFTRLSTWTLFSIHYFLYLLFSKKPSQLVVVTNPPFAPFVTAIVAGLRGIPFHIVVFDLYPEVLQAVSITSHDSWIFRLWQGNNRWTFSRARSIITLSDSMKAAISRYRTDDVHVIFNWADTEYIKPIKREANPFIKNHDLSDKFIVMYSGNMGLTHDLESLLEAADRVRDDRRILFVLIGEGGKKVKLETTKQQRQLENVVFLPYQDAANFPYAIAAADIGIITLGLGGESISVPSKTYVNMAAGLALIAISPKNSELTNIVEGYHVGFAVEPGHPEELANYIRRMAGDASLLASFKNRSRETSLNFTSANATAYLRVLR